MIYDDENPTRPPRPAPFPVGTRLRCIDKARGPVGYGRDGSPGEYVTIYGFGLEVVIDAVHPGRRGSGRLVDLNDGEEPFTDSTRDGYSVYHVEGTRSGRCIFPEDADRWEVIP